MIIWCPSCQLPSIIRRAEAGRESQVCVRCKSNSRQRGLVLAARAAHRAIRQQKRLVRAIGISDGQQTEKWASKHFKDRYINYHFHREPRLDLTKIPKSLEASHNLIFCSEVLEHVEPPVSRAFRGLSLLLESGGFVVLSVPYTPIGSSHVEHFAELSDARLDETADGLVWRGFSSDGVEHSYKNLTFHGGLGATLEFRVFSEESLEAHLNEAGLDVVFKLQNQRLFGVTWQPWSRVWLVKKH